jgi:four helix bundle protein
MSDTTTRFAHQKLDAYRVAMELFVGVEAVAKALPQGHADLKDQVRRSAAATVRHIAEGANREHARDRAARFSMARGECGECAATLEMAAAIGIVRPDRVAKLLGLADRIGAMLCGLIRAQRSTLGTRNER